MKKGNLFILCFLVFFLGFTGDAFEAIAWSGGGAMGFGTYEGAKSTGGVTGVIAWFSIWTSNPLEADRVKSISAQNTDPGIDLTIYSGFSRLNEIKKNGITYNFNKSIPYTGQHGEYRIQITYQDNSTETLTYTSINEMTTPIAPVSGVEIDYSAVSFSYLC